MSLGIFNHKDSNDDPEAVRRQDFLARMERKWEQKTANQDDYLSADR